MTPEEREELQQKLLALRDELGGMLDASVDAARAVGLDQPIGRVSRMDAIQQQSMVVAGRRAAQQRLERVRGAMQRLSDDSYGECLECGEEVPFARLKVRPEAPFCVACQSKREKE